MLINISNYPAEEVSFKAEGAELILGEKQGEITLIPRDFKATLKIFYKDSLLATEIFPVRLIPKPELQMYVGNSTLPHSFPNEISKVELNQLRIHAQAPEYFENSVPKDAQFQVSLIEVSLARERKLIGSLTVSDSEVINLENLIKSAEIGDRLIIEIKRIERMTYKGHWEESKISNPVFIINIK
ncbi:GldM C-terminal domain-containing protein [Thermoflexibacter ruber]|uniref:GldM C-terminal domain-containing protein n=2 Tax=Thermoflexibacter ruber TaxID=1003 RepID=A0A1I2HRZ4_9BACT|nr:GldM C-terminal domain-containing protein [Thermoflexibacter ruber]